MVLVSIERKILFLVSAEHMPLLSFLDRDLRTVCF
jgi:hypothetical protein